MQTTLRRSMTYPVIITRPDPGAKVLESRLRETLGSCARILSSPLFEIEVLRENLPELTSFNGLVVTSAHAIESLSAHAFARTLPCYCVGSATAAAARAAGLQAIDGGGTAETLLAKIKSDVPAGPLLYARGKHVSVNLARLLNQAGIETDQAILYRQKALDLTDTAMELLSKKGPVVVPFFSARTTKLFFAQTDTNATLYVAAISEKVAEAVPTAKASRIAIAAEPTLDAMVRTISSLASAT